VPVTRPAENPDNRRPTNSQAVFDATMNAMVLSTLNPTAAMSTGRLPTWSDDRPASSRAPRTPAAYVAKINVTTPDEKCHRAS
jgi:hypothetical protein